jgi:hypothetical protein
MIRASAGRVPLPSLSSITTWQTSGAFSRTRNSELTTGNWQEEKFWRVYALPAPFIDLLAGVKSQDAPDLARRWYAEWDMPDLQDEASLEELIGELVRLAQTAKAGQKSILVRWSEG